MQNKYIPEQPPRAFHRILLSKAAALGGEEAQELSDQLENLFDGRGFAVLTKNRNPSDGDDWALELNTPFLPDLKTLAAEILEATGAVFTLRAEAVADVDWLQQVHRDFPPIALGRFFVYGSHYVGAMPKNKIALNIDAATAFGSGEHETTKACLMALELLHDKPCAKALDMGCGSGILALAIKKLWPDAAVLAVDIDPESVRVTKRHADMNDADVMAVAGDGYAAKEVGAAAVYDLITANILAGPLIAMAPDLNRVLKPGGFAVLSGLLVRQ
jgi:ribosomal protein L11 methyltransferase